MRCSWSRPCAPVVEKGNEPLSTMELRMHLHRYEYVKPILAGALLAASIAGSAEGEPPGAGYAQAWHPAPRPQSAQYCAQLLGTFDKFTASRATESSDGAHNHV